MKVAEEKRPFYENRVLLEAITSGLERNRGKIQDMAEAWSTLDTEIPLTTDLIRGAYDSNGAYHPENLEKILLKEMAEKTGMVGKPYNLERVMSFLDRPDISALEEPFNECPSFTTIFDNAVYWQCYQIQGTQVTLVQDEVDKVVARYQAFTETPAEEKRLRLVEAVRESLLALQGEYPEIPLEKLSVPGLIEGSAEGLVILPTFVKEARLQPERVGIFSSKFDEGSKPQDIRSAPPSYITPQRPDPEDQDEAGSEAVARQLANKRNSLVGANGVMGSSGVVGKKLI